MNTKHAKAMIESYYFLFTIIFFFIDIICTSLCEQPVMHAVLAAYSVFLLKKTSSLGMYIIPIPLLALETFFLHGRFDTTFIFLIPVILCALYVQRIFHSIRALYYLFLSGSLCIKLLIIDPYFLHVTPQLNFIVLTLATNILFLWFLLSYNTHKTRRFYWGYR